MLYERADLVRRVSCVYEELLGDDKYIELKVYMDADYSDNHVCVDLVSLVYNLSLTLSQRTIEDSEDLCSIAARNIVEVRAAIALDKLEVADMINRVAGEMLNAS